MAEQMVRANSVELCVETFGAAANPAVLLIAGAASSMDWWDQELCARLSQTGRYVICYDHRDTGRSPSSAPGVPDYDGKDMREDVLGVLDALNVGRAHLVGISMGGAIAQYVAVKHPDRLNTLTLMSTSPVFDAGPDYGTLPPPTERAEAAFDTPMPDWTDRDAVIAWHLDAERNFGGSIPVDEARIRRIAGRAFDRTTNMAASQNHLSVGGESPHATLSDIDVPTLVLHGTEDPLFPIEHGRALAGAVPDAYLVSMHGVGHQVPPAEVWDLVVPAIRDHTALR